MANQEARPVQIQISEWAWQVLKVYGATKGVTANVLIRELAEQEAEKVREKVEPVL